MLSRIGPYEILEEIARGGMGTVYRALDPRTGRRVALKLLLDESPRFRERFAREARLLARLNHPNVVRVHDAGEAKGKPYLVMELVEGTSLEHELRRGPLEPRRAAEVVASVARGAGHAHAHGLVHRDIKPDNVLLRPDGQVVLTDFGLARDVEVTSELSKSGIFMGTPGYASPEQARGEGKHVGPASDVYGLGALLFALLCARPPHVGSLMEVMVLTVNEPAPSPRAQGSPVDATLDALCRRCMAKEPGERYPDGDALADALEAYLAGALAPPPRTRSALLGFGLVGVVAMGAVLWFGLSQPAEPDVGEAPELDAAPPTQAPTPDASAQVGPSRTLTRALRRVADLPLRPLRDKQLDAAIESLGAALERVGPASNRPQAERRLAELYARRSESVLQRTPTQITTDLRSALALESTQARKNALAEALLGQALVLGGNLELGLEWERAKASYLEAMALLPRDPRPALVLGKQARSRKDWATWLSANEEAARRAPDDERPLIQISRALARADRAGEALDRLRPFLAAHPQALGAWGELGDRERARGRWANARQAYERAGGATSAAPEVLVGLAAVALEEQRNELALVLCERAGARGARNGVFAVRALARHRTGDALRALPDYEAAWGVKESEPLWCDLLLGHLDALRSLGRKTDARLEACLADPRLGKHAGLVAQVIHYASIRQHPRANQALRELLRDRSLTLNPRADCALSEWLSRWGTYDLPQVALKLAQRAARTTSTDEDAAAFVLAGRILMRMGRHREAWSALDQALAIHPTRADLHHTRAELGADSGRYELGLTSGRRARELQPNEPYVCIYMTWSLLALGRFQDALPLMDVAVGRLKESATGLRALVRACAGKVQGARQDLERARKHDAKARELRLAQAQLLLETGDRPSAIAAFTTIQAETMSRHQADFIKRQLERARQR